MRKAGLSNLSRSKDTPQLWEKMKGALFTLLKNTKILFHYSNGRDAHTHLHNTHTLQNGGYKDHMV